MLSPLQTRVVRIVAALDEAAELALAGGAAFDHPRRVADDDARTEIDLGYDARLFPIERRDPAPVLSGEELAVDKVLAIFGRAEPRDFTDLMAIERHHGRDCLIALASGKDRGLGLQMFAQMLGTLDRFDAGELEVTDEQRTPRAERVEWSRARHRHG